MNNLQLSVLTPEKKVSETEALSVTLPTKMGDITVLPSHAPLFSLLAPGEIIIRKAQGSPESLVVSGGYVSVFKNQVKVLADFSMQSSDINEQAAKEAIERAKQAMEEKVSDESFALAEAEMRKALAQLWVAQKRKRN